MYSRLLLLPAALVAPAAAVTALVTAVAPAPAWAESLQAPEAAQQLLFRGETLEPFEFRLADAQYEQLKREYAVPALRPLVKGWRASRGGWLYLDQVYGLNDIVTYLVAIDASGKVSGIEVLTCAEGYCDLFTREWRATLVGQTHGKWEPTEVAPIVSGATLSCTHVAEGVKKVLAIHARFRPQL